VRARAVDRVGNTSERTLRPVTVRRDHEPPAIAASLRGGTLTWRARDAGTPWVTLRLVLRRGGAVTQHRLVHAALAGRRTLELDDRLRHATLVASDSAGNRTVVPLGHVGFDMRLPPT
jgi:hypothetical protein